VLVVLQEEQQHTSVLSRAQHVNTRHGEGLGRMPLVTRLLPCAALPPTDRIRVNWVLKAISRTPEGLYKLQYDTPSGPASLTARSVAMTIPAWALADLIKDQVGGWVCVRVCVTQEEGAGGAGAHCPLLLPAAAAVQAPAASQALASFDYPPVGAVTLAYPESAIREDRKAADGSVPGFGQLHPRSQVCLRVCRGERQPMNNRVAHAACIRWCTTKTQLLHIPHTTPTRTRV
jgi:hypothetical protein